jgi:SAM-dependent methyltransferase
MREQRLVFGEVAELYDRARAAYSEAVIDDVLRFAGGDGSRLRALEFGAGTGKATVAFAVRGLAIVAIEPSAAMAAVARRNCKPFPNVRLECTTFEDWAVEANPLRSRILSSGLALGDARGPLREGSRGPFSRSSGIAHGGREKSCAPSWRTSTVASSRRSTRRTQAFRA